MSSMLPQSNQCGQPEGKKSSPTQEIYSKKMRKQESSPTPTHRLSSTEEKCVECDLRSEGRCGGDSRLRERNSNCSLFPQCSMDNSNRRLAREATKSSPSFSSSCYKPNGGRVGFEERADDLTENERLKTVEDLVKDFQDSSDEDECNFLAGYSNKSVLIGSPKVKSIPTDFNDDVGDEELSLLVERCEHEIVACESVASQLGVSFDDEGEDHSDTELVNSMEKWENTASMESSNCENSLLTSFCAEDLEDKEMAVLVDQVEREECVNSDFVCEERGLVLIAEACEQQVKASSGECQDRPCFDNVHKPGVCSQAGPVYRVQCGGLGAGILQQ